MLYYENQGAATTTGSMLGLTRISGGNWTAFEAHRAVSTGQAMSVRRRVNWAQLTRKWASKFRNDKIRPMRIKTARAIADLSVRNPVYNTLLRM